MTYSFLVINTGTSRLTGLGITDDLFSGTGALPTASCPVVTLAPNASTTCTSGYRMSTDDADARVVNNTATASAIRPGGAAVMSAQSSAPVTIDPVAAALATTGGVLTWGAPVSAFGAIATGIGLAVTSSRQRRLHSA